MTTYYYARISTKETDDKQSYERQMKGFMTYAKKNDITFNQRYVYKDDITGSTFNRPDWNELLGNLNSGDTIVFKEISRFTRQADEGYTKYMELMEKGINLVFIDNPTVSTDYIKNLTKIAEQQERIAKTALKNTIELLLMVELDRVEKEREIIVKRIKDGIKASGKVAGRKVGSLDKMSDELRADIELFIKDRTIKQIDVMNKHNISRNTLKKYVQIIQSN